MDALDAYHLESGGVMTSFANRLIEKVVALIHNKTFLDESRKEDRFFTRERTLGFVGVMTLCLNVLVRSLQIEIGDFIERFKPCEKSYSKQAFSQARAKIRPEAFRALFAMTVDEAFDNDAIGRRRGFRIFAIDGTTLRLPESKDIWANFTTIGGSRLPHARASFLYDVTNGYVVDARLANTTIDERTMALEHLEAVKSRLCKNDLILADRGYASKALIHYMQSTKIQYLFRLQASFSAEIDDSNESDFIWNMAFKRETIAVRIVKFALPSGEIETLITNLFDETLTASDFAEIYALRWGIETRYNLFKNALCIEEFSGKTTVTLEQDFYARVFLMNIEAAIKVESDALIAARDDGKNLKYDRKTNEKILVGILKRRFAAIVFEPDPAKREATIRRIIEEASHSVTSIKPGRSFPRECRSHKRITAPPKRVL